MTDEEKAEKSFDKIKLIEDVSPRFNYIKGYLDGLAEGRKEKCLEQNKDGTIRPCEVMKDNEQLKKEISILLSCSNCPENNGGYICEKEYNNKCLAQKIEYIKELKEENTEFKAQIESMKSVLKEIADYSDCKASENMAKNELKKWS